MTKFYYREYYDNLIISIEGHAGFESYGKDIVCAGISTLAYTLLNSLCDEEAADNIKFIKKIVREGYMYFEFSFFDYSKTRVKGITDALINGFLMLEDSYPQHIKVV